MTQRIIPGILWTFLAGTAPVFAQNAPPDAATPPAAVRAETLDALFEQAELRIRRIHRLDPGLEKSAAIEELRSRLEQIDATYTEEEKADHARRTLAALRAEVARQRQRLKQAGMAMAEANNAEPPDLAAVQATGSDYTLQDAILRALEEKEKKAARRQSMGTAEALRLMQEVE